MSFVAVRMAFWLSPDLVQEDLYYPHSWLQDILWGTLHKVAEPVLTSWPGSKLREKALAEAIKHIHYEDESTRYLDIGPVNKVRGPSLSLSPFGSRNRPPFVLTFKFLSSWKSYSILHRMQKTSSLTWCRSGVPFRWGAGPKISDVFRLWTGAVFEHVVMLGGGPEVGGIQKASGTGEGLLVACRRWIENAGTSNVAPQQQDARNPFLLII